MKHLWQPIVDRYWQTVRDWIVVKNKDREKAIAWKEVREKAEREKAEREAEEKAEREAEEKAEREAEKERLQKMAERKRDEKVAKELEGRKRKQLEKDIGNSTSKKKKKHPQSQKSAPTIMESDEEDGGRAANIITANQAMFLEKGVEIIEEASLQASHTSSKYSGDPREAPCNRCRYWVSTHGCVTWLCRDVVERKACATCTASNISCVMTGEAIQCEKKGGGTPKRWALGLKMDDEGRPEIFDHLGFVEADLDTLKQTVGELYNLTRIQVMSQLLTYRLFEVNNTIQPPGFQEQREQYRRSATKIFGKDHLGEDMGLSGAIGDEDEADASGEETDGKYPNKTLRRGDDMVERQDFVPGTVELSEESETGIKGSGGESEMKSEKMTPKTKASVPNIVESEESEGSAKMSDTSLDGEEGLDKKSEEMGDYLPTKGKKSGKQVMKK
ncbi:hypothetical protein M422DRAFT_239436 [Sphaerobolus stellatus SS14]|nr:hypothetical protein M422DRAFT_239436 [Sphaerobolus stellatus SS14]